MISGVGDITFPDYGNGPVGSIADADQIGQEPDGLSATISPLVSEDGQFIECTFMPASTLGTIQSFEVRISGRVSGLIGNETSGVSLSPQATAVYGPDETYFQNAGGLVSLRFDGIVETDPFDLTGSSGVLEPDGSFTAVVVPITSNPDAFWRVPVGIGIVAYQSVPADPPEDLVLSIDSIQFATASAVDSRHDSALAERQEPLLDVNAPPASSYDGQPIPGDASTLVLAQSADEVAAQQRNETD